MSINDIRNGSVFKLSICIVPKYSIFKDMNPEFV